MKRYLRVIALVTACSVGLSGCRGSAALIGLGVGLATAVVAYGIISYLDSQDREKHNNAMASALNKGVLGSKSNWATPGKGTSGEVEVLSEEFQDQSRRPCRTVRHAILVKGVVHNEVGTVCRDPSGAWVSAPAT